MFGDVYPGHRRAEALLEQPEDLELLRRTEGAVALAHQTPFDVDLWRIQNRCYELRRSVYPRLREDPAAAEWVRLFKALAERLAVRVE